MELRPLQNLHQRKVGKHLAIEKTGADVDLNDLATKVSYLGNPKHKQIPWWGGAPRPDTRGTLCPKELHEDREFIQTWLQDAVRKGAIGKFGNGAFPRHIWYFHQGEMYQANLDNRETGTYHGYPIKNKRYWPRGYQKIYGKN